MSSPAKNKSVIMVTDTHLSYITLEKKADGFSLSQYEILELPEGILSQGEILKADIFYKILKKIGKKIKNKNIDVLMAHSFFYYAHDDLEASSKKVPLKKRIQKYFKNKKKKEDWHDTHVCEFSLHTRHDRETVFLNCLPTNIQSSHTHVFKKAGFNIMTFNSSMLSFDHFCNHEKDLLIFIAKDTMRVLEFISGMYVSRKTFSASYLQFIQDIQKHLNIDSDAAKDILMQHGLLRSHKDQKVYKQLIRSLSPLVKFMTQRKAKRGEHISVVFEDYQIPGFIDLIKKNFKVPVSHLDVLNNESYPFQEILSIHKNETYPYQAHIAQALKNWRS